MNEWLIENAKEYVHTLFAENADGHDAAHTLRVYRNAMRLADAYPNADRIVIALAALLHDADDRKIFDTEDYANARAFLQSQNCDGECSERVIAAVSTVSFSQNKSKKPDTIEGKIVQDADRLDALGAVGIARTFAYGGRKGRPLSSSVDHFYEKLLLLKDAMNTPEAKKLAAERHAFLETFLDELDKETK